MTPQNLKKSETKLRTLKTSHDDLVRQRRELDRQIKEKNKEINLLENELKKQKVSNKKPIISEHAMLRYLERIEGLDLESLQEKILDETTSKNILKLKDCKYPLTNKNGEKFKLIVKDNVVVTIEN